MAFITTNRHRQQHEPPGTGHIPSALREAYELVDEATLDKLRRKCSKMPWKQIGGRTIYPADNAADFAEALHHERLDVAGLRVKSAANSAAYEATLRRATGCEEECDAYGSAVRSRRYGDGTVRRLCERHHALEVPKVLERLQAEERAKR